MLFHDRHHHPNHYRQTSQGTIKTSLYLANPPSHRYHQTSTVSGRISLQYCASDHLPQHSGPHRCGDSDELIAPFLKIGVSFVGRVSLVVSAGRASEKDETIEEVLFERVQWLCEGEMRLRCWEETGFEFAFAFSAGVGDGCEQRGWEFGVDGLHQVRERGVLPSSFCHGFGRNGGVEPAKVEYFLRPIVEVGGIDVDVELCQNVEVLYWPVGKQDLSCLESGERQFVSRSGEVKLRRHLHDIATQQMATREHKHGFGAKMMAIAHLHHQGSTVMALDVICNLPKHIFHDRPIALQIEVQPTLTASLQDLRTDGLELSIIEICSACTDNGPRHERRLAHPIIDSIYALGGTFAMINGCYRRRVETAAAMKLELPPAFNFRHGTILRTYLVHIKFTLVLCGQKVPVEEEVEVEILGQEWQRPRAEESLMMEGGYLEDAAEVPDVLPPRYEDVFQGLNRMPMQVEAWS